ncbi:septum formation inhibitor Maf [Akkermansiaceae bacterium]|nr:septum formation inhibitor Maf [Akkermansiaceae bacterium]
MKAVSISLLLILPLHADKIRDHWFSGAEISSYRLTQSHYGESHPGHAELIFVTEPFLLGQQVKDESGRGDSADILKLNALTTFHTGIYSYRTMTSTFRPIDLERFPHALKSTTSIQDWCGQAFQQSNFRENGWSVQLRSYFESAGDKDLTLPAAHLEDALWITLRLDPKKLPTGKTEIIPGAIFTRLNHQPIAAVSAMASLTESGKTSTYKISYPSLERTLAIRFDTVFPHVIRNWQETTPKGTTTAILSKRLENIDYWRMNKPGDAVKRKELGLSPVAD